MLWKIISAERENCGLLIRCIWKCAEWVIWSWWVKDSREINSFLNLLIFFIVLFILQRTYCRKKCLFKKSWNNNIYIYNLLTMYASSHMMLITLWVSTSIILILQMRKTWHTESQYFAWVFLLQSVDPRLWAAWPNASIVAFIFCILQILFLSHVFCLTLFTLFVKNHFRWDLLHSRCEVTLCSLNGYKKWMSIIFQRTRQIFF